MAKIFVSDEIEPLRKVLVHRPDTGISRISPRKAEELLFDDIVHLPQMQKEHDTFTKVLKAFLGDETLCPTPPLLKRESINEAVINTEDTYFRLLPNPARNEVRIVWDEQPKGEIYVEFLNINGQVVKREKTTAGVKEHNILLSSLSKGLYLVRIHNEDSIIGTQKLIILD